MRFKQVIALYLLCTGCFIARSQTTPAGYAARWKVIDSLIIQKDLTTTALQEVNTVYTLARQEKNEPQAIRALVYLLSLEQAKSEDGVIPAINELEKEVAATSSQPARSILENMLAGLFQTYLRQNMHRIINRKNTNQQPTADIAVWSVGDLSKKTSELYLRSLKEETLLTQKSVASYAPIILQGNVSFLRPTLFDLLAHNALTFFNSPLAFTHGPSLPMDPDDTAMFADAAIFSGHHFSPTDSLETHYQGLLLFQRLIRLHLNDKDPSALVDVDIDRIIFANSIAGIENKQELYLAALDRLTARYETLPAAAQAWYLQASYYYYRHINQPELADDSMDSWKAKAICEKVVAEKDSSEGQRECTSLLQTIQQKQLTLETERVNIPYKPFRALVSWQNFSRLYMRLLHLDKPEEAPRQIYDSASLKQLLAMPVNRSYAQELPDIRDLRVHRVEIAIGSLPPGYYALLGSSDSSWSRNSGVMAIEYFSVSSIAFINRGEDYFVLNRETGQPLAGATLQLWTRTPAFARGSEKQTLVKKGTFTTDKDGYCRIALGKSSGYEQLLVEVTTHDDHLFPLENGSFNQFTAPGPDPATLTDKSTFEDAHLRSFLFTDRSIYRPGQTVYFKGITVTQDFETHQAKVVPGHSTTITLFNPNNQTVDTLPVTTNDFGSYHGSFKLPENQLNGRYRIYNESGGQQSFSVEEYKRPKFYIDYEKQKGSYRIGDSIRVTATARGYAGNAIGAATVRYRVTRRAYFPHTWLFWRTSAPFPQSVDLAHGTTKTDAAGKLSFVFYAAPDRNASAKLDPEFSFEINADVTDISGETQSASTHFGAGYSAVRLSIILAHGDRMAADSFRRLLVYATNLSGEPTAAEIHTTIYPLQSPQRLIKTRLWPVPDRWLYPEKEWLDSFPHDAYRQEDHKESWERGGKIFDTTLAVAAADTADRKAGTARISLSGSTLTPGWYVIEAQTVDKYGHPAKDLRYIELFDEKTGRPGSPQYIWNMGSGSYAEPGEKARVALGSSAAGVFVIRSVEHGKETSQAWKNGFREGLVDNTDTGFTHFALEKGSRTVEWPVTEADRGGFAVMDAFVKDNRLYTNRTNVMVPWTNKELHIRYASFRDKTEPGSGEKWELQISGHNGEKVSAEVLTAMYDSSLDQFASHSWNAPYLYPVFTARGNWGSGNNFTFQSSQLIGFDRHKPNFYRKVYDQLLQPQGNRLFRTTLETAVKGYYNTQVYRDEVTYPAEMYSSALGVGFQHDMNPDIRWGGAPGALQRANIRGAAIGGNIGDQVLMAKTATYAWSGTADQGPPHPPVIQARKDFRETAFFFPDLRTDSAGNVSFSFTMPEALTTWKWLTLASSRDLAFGYSEKSVITQKKLMVQPNLPRFLREGDRLELQVKVANLTDSEQTGQMSLQLTDPTTGQTADGWFVNRQPNQYFTVGARQSAVVNFPLDIPYQYNRPLTYRVVAQAGAYSDGEEGILPVVSNRMLVTESLPLSLPGDGTRQFSFDKLLKSGSSETLNHHSLTVEFTANPTWYAVQSLPYLMEYPYACAEQTFDRFYANALASKIATASPRLQQEFSRWRTADTTELLSNLQKNQELKTVLLEETPWVLQGKTEAQQKKNIALLFDLHRMSAELESTLEQLQSVQSESGAFPWFKGGLDDRYITQYILTGIGHLQRLQAIPPAMKDKMDTIVKKALVYLDAAIRKDYERRNTVTVKAGAKGIIPEASWIGELAIQYLYMRSEFPDYGVPGDVFPAMNYFRKKAQQGWVQRNRYLQGMIALALYRTGDVQTAKDIIKALKQNAIRDEEKGMYWKGMEGGYFWYNAPVETQSLLIEAFREISSDPVADRQMKTWLLRRKQTHSWPTTIATADACYALLLGGGDWLTGERTVAVRLGDKTIAWPGDGQTGGGVGYYKKIYDAPFVNPSMGNITVTMSGIGKDGGSPAWGAVYWQYFDMPDRITPPGGSKPVLSVRKRLLVQRNTDHGVILDTLVDNGTLKPGDKVVVRLELRADRDLEYVYMKDMRAACMEPVDVISQYKWEEGIGYYESTKDLSTDFFFGYLPRGVHIFDYTLLVGQHGNFSNGITSIECMYAPEFSWHSEGIRVNVEELH